MPSLVGSGDLFGSPHSASYNGPVVDDLYTTNREWAEEQAQKQMDYQTAANKIAMDFSAEQVEKQRAFELEMANSAFQRRVLDLKKAGLNPILAYSQGGAAVPSVSSAQGVSSAGAKAAMADTGYTASAYALNRDKFEYGKYYDKKQLEMDQKRLQYDYVKLAVNSALDVAGKILDFLPKTSYIVSKKG